MKKQIFNGLIVLSFLILFFQILFNKSLVIDSVNYALNIWVTALIPSSFPFFVISDILINYQITNYIPEFIKKYLAKLFNVSNFSISIFFLSLFSGFPSNARNAKNFYDKGLIDEKEASFVLTFTHFSNPMFVLSTVGGIFLHNDGYGYLILISHYLGNLLVGIILRNFNDYNNNNNYKVKQDKSQSFSSILISAVKSSIDTLLIIAGTLTCFMIVSSLVLSLINLGSYQEAILKGILEMTMGLKAISLVNVSDIYKVVISTGIISFGGLAVHLQVLSQLVDTNISYKPFFIARILHLLISMIISFFLFIILF